MEAEIGREILDLVPQWYEADCGPFEVSIPVKNHVTRFYNHCPLTEHLNQFLEKVCEKTRELPLDYFVQLPSLSDVLLESLAIDWLRIHSGSTDWQKLVRYLESLARRTHENAPVSLNRSSGGQGTGDITQPRQKSPTPASSPVSYLAVDSGLHLIEYREVD